MRFVSWRRALRSIGRMWFRIAKRLRMKTGLISCRLRSARSRNGRILTAGLFDFLRDVLTMEVKGKQETEFVLRFQQFTGPVMAKGVEDTAFYCYNRLTGLNEVGNDPGRDGLSVAEFHAYCAKMQATHPVTMTTLATHDTKRSDDVRARLAVLSEIPGRFGGVVQRWSRMNREFRTGDMPDRNTEYLYYQTLIGAWPLPVDRAQAYMLKAVREAKEQTTWVANNKEFEDALHLFVEKTLGHEPFLKELEQFVEKVKGAGAGELAGADADEAYGAGCAGSLSGNGALGFESGGSG